MPGAPIALTLKRKVMKKRFAVVIVLFAAVWSATVSAQTQTAEKPRLAVFGFLNQTYAIPAETASSNLLVTMRTLNLFQVSEPETIPRSLAEMSLDQWCTKNGIDSVIFGTVSKAPDGTQEYELMFFSHATKKIIARKTERGASVLDVFPAIDTLTEAMLGTITKNKVSFGSLAFENRGVAGEYDVYIDNVFIQTNPAKFDRVPAGTHAVRVVQKGSGANLVSGEVTVAQGKTETVQFALKELAEADSIPAPAMPAGKETAPNAARGGTYEQGAIDGTKKAEGSSAGYFFAGCCLGFPGLIIPAIVEPTVPPEFIAGKSPEYVLAFQSAYKTTKKTNNIKLALIGTGTSLIVGSVTYLVSILLVLNAY
jgi:hypothetical protein